MPFKGGPAEVRFARSAALSHEEIQKALDEFQVAIAAAVITLGNLGCDPEVMGRLMKVVAEGITVEGYASIVEPFRTDEHGAPYLSRLPAINQEFAKLGGHGERHPLPAGFGDDLLAELGLRPRRAIDIN